MSESYRLYLYLGCCDPGMPAGDFASVADAQAAAEEQSMAGADIARVCPGAPMIVCIGQRNADGAWAWREKETATVTGGVP